MVIPIYPNTAHPTGRAAIPPEAPFPFPNCYLWIDTGLTVRIRRKALRYDDTPAPILSIPESISIGERFREDYLRMDAVRHQKLGLADTTAFGGDTCGGSAPPSPPGGHFAEERRSPQARVDPHPADADSLPEGSNTHTDCDSVDMMPSTPSGHDCRPDFNASVTELLQLDFFGFNMDDTVEFLPLVDMWFEVTDHLTAETIPSPTELFEERRAIMQYVFCSDPALLYSYGDCRIIHDARERAPSTRSPFVDSGVSIDYDAISHLSISSSVRLPWEVNRATREAHSSPTGTAGPEPRGELTSLLSSVCLVVAAHLYRQGAHALGKWRRLRCAVEHLFSRRIPWRVHPPCLPFWP